MTGGKIEQRGGEGALGAAVLDNMARDSLPEEVIIELKGIRKLAMESMGERGQAEGTARRAPRRESACKTLGTAEAGDGREWQGPDHIGLICNMA